MSLLSSSSFFLIGGGLIILAAFVLVLMNKAVSTGHSLMFAVGAAVVLIPYVSNFEWSGTGLKFTTRDDTASLARQVIEIQKDGVQLRSQISDLASGLKSVTERIAALEASTSQGSNVPIPDQRPIWTPDLLDQFISKNNEAKIDAQKRVDTLQSFEKELMNPAIQ